MKQVDLKALGGVSQLDIESSYCNQMWSVKDKIEVDVLVTLQCPHIVWLTVYSNPAPEKF